MNINTAFEKMGARVKVERVSDDVRWVRRTRMDGNVAMDVRRDRKGEFFEILLRDGVGTQILDVKPKDRHLLIMVRDPENPKARFLCGHDERHWFTAAIPETAGASNVAEAKEALKPAALREIENKRGVKRKNRQKRHRKAAGGTIHRQGEFTFVPMPDMAVKDWLVQKKEPLAQRGNPHVADFLYRTGGTTRYFHTNFPEGVDVHKYNKLVKERDERARGRWDQRTTGMRAFVKGKIRHIEHATVDLGNIWHEVIVNTEALSISRSNVVFMD